MDEVIRPDVTWIEVFSRSREVTLRQRIDSRAIRLGRAFDNDVVLDDPHVAAHHLRIERNGEGRWVAEDLGSLNGLFVNGARTRTQRVVLDAATTLHIGHTALRLRSSSETVPAESPLLRSVPRWPLGLACIALVLALELLGLWLGETGEPKLIRYLTPLLTLGVIVAIWTAAWSVVSRVFSGHARFGVHLLIAGAGLLVFSLCDQLFELGAFALSWPMLARSLYVAGWFVFAAVCFAHLRTLGRTHLPLKALAVLALAALGITMQSLRLSDWRSNYGQASTLQRLEPPSLRIAGAQSEAAFFAASETLKTTLDKARTEEPVSGDADAGSGE